MTAEYTTQRAQRLAELIENRGIEMIVDAFGVPNFGFLHDDEWIFDPSLSSCGRFVVHREHYGLTEQELNDFSILGDLLSEAVESAINAGAKDIQGFLGVESGDFAGIFFSEDEQKNGLRRMLGSYMLDQIVEAVTDKAQPGADRPK